jgi:hypothetical protein
MLASPPSIVATVKIDVGVDASPQPLPVNSNGHPVKHVLVTASVSAAIQIAFGDSSIDLVSPAPDVLVGGSNRLAHNFFNVSGKTHVAFSGSGMMSVSALGS